MRGSASSRWWTMSSEQRRALRIALTFTASFIAAELLRADLQLTFVAPLVAASLACQPKVPGRVAFVLPLIAWTMVTIAGLMLQFLITKPVVVALLLLWVFWGGFTLLRSPRSGTLGLVILLVFAIVPQTLIKAPELDADLAWWFGLDFALAVAADGSFVACFPNRRSLNLSCHRRFCLRLAQRALFCSPSPLQRQCSCRLPGQSLSASLLF